MMALGLKRCDSELPSRSGHDGIVNASLSAVRNLQPHAVSSSDAPGPPVGLRP
jgi:hypothetical protein